MFWWTIVPFGLWGVHLWAHLGAHASTSASVPSSKPSHDFSFDDSWLEVYSYVFIDFPGCFEVRGNPAYVGDSDCDSSNNNEECDYDGGDCCVCTCVDAEYKCVENQFYSCLDPDVSDECREESDLFDPYVARGENSDFSGCAEIGGNSWSIGNGRCEIYNSNEACGYDGGDCCSCTCKETGDDVCGSNGGYYCTDPTVSAECKEESASYIPLVSSTTGYRYSQHPGCYEAGGSPRRIGNGHCDYSNSIEECDYDGGDCCICTCADGDEKRCGEYPGYYCQDPTVSEGCRQASLTLFHSSYLDTVIEYPACLEARSNPSLIGDGNCDLEVNVEECGYDGGDCCSCTCEDTNVGRCGEEIFYCQDPSVSAECVEESKTFYPASFESWDDYSQYYVCWEASGRFHSAGDGTCDPSNNIEECGYDGGDCCICTCVETEGLTCGEYGGYWCQDPSVPAACVEESAAYVPAYSTSALVRFYEYSECSKEGGDVGEIGNGDCDFLNNIEECGYDGGDCCICTCVDTEFNTCGENGGYYCTDPRVSEACKEASDSYIPFVSSFYNKGNYIFSQYPGCYEAGGFSFAIGDGWCDPGNNKEACAYDGGDCCSCTCNEEARFGCSSSGYDCKDPTVSPECLEASAS